MNIIATMSLTGSTLFLLYEILIYFGGSYFSARWKCLILKTSLLLFLIPLGIIRTSVENFYFRIMNRDIYGSFIINGKSNAIIISTGGHFMTPSYKVQFIFTLIWLLMASSIFTWYIIKYLKHRRLVTNAMHQVFNSEILKLLTKYRSLLHIQRNIQIYTCSANISPFTIGIIKPVFIIPDGLDFYKCELIIRHELIHIRNYDSLFKFLRLVVLGLYWFNPLIYLLDKALDRVSEMACDELLVQNMCKDERLCYAYLIIDMATISNFNQYTTAFSSGNDILKERGILIMNMKNKNIQYKWFSVTMAFGIVLCSTFTSFAYEAPQKIILEEETIADYFPQNENGTVAYKTIVEAGQFPAENQSILFDTQFVDKDGAIYSIDDRDTYGSCKHTYNEGIVEKHTKTSNGGCRLKTYSAKRCSKCGSVKIGALQTDFTYTKCPH